MISSLQNEQVKYWVSLKEKKNRDIHKQYIVEGMHMVLEAIKSNDALAIITCNLLTEKFELPVIEVSKEVFKKISSTITPQGVAALCRVKNNSVIEDKRVIYLDGVQDPSNAGAILRSAVAFNYDTIVFSSDSVDLYNDKFLRATQGYFYQINLLKDSGMDYLMNTKKIIIVTSLDDDSVQIDEAEAEKNHVLVIGNEGQGVKKEILALANLKVKIPIAQSVDSLNASIAASICMYILSK